jgi:membrane AbrB-like protein
MDRFPPPAFLLITIAALALGGVGGSLAAWAHLPMPFLLGSLASTGVVVALADNRFPSGYRFPQRFRLIFIAVIGVMIGAQVSPELLSQVPSMLVSFTGVLLFVLAAHATNYRLLTRLGGYDPATAFYGSAPGGLIESITLGEAAGGDVRVLTLLQFLRIVTVLTLVPVALSLWHGAPVGSAAGLSLARGVAGWGDIAAVLVVGISGLALGFWLRLPAAQLTGPLLVGGVLTGTGLWPLAAPGWLLALAQVVLGVSLGLRFVGVDRRLLGKAMAMSLVTVSAMFAMGAALALAVRALTGLSFDVLMISYAPGGVTEMSLIAVSLAANPALVTLHHLFRITLTVVELGVVRRLGLVRF